MNKKHDPLLIKKVKELRRKKMPYKLIQYEVAQLGFKDISIPSLRKIGQLKNVK